MKNEQIIAEYKCEKCGHGWLDYPGPRSTYWSEKGAAEGDPNKYSDKFCPNCGHLYAKWLNYEMLKKKHGWV